jgi:phospholipase C
MPHRFQADALTYFSEGETVKTKQWHFRSKLLAALAATTVLAGAGATQALAAAKTTTPIQHVIVIFGENISFDHYFATYPNAQNPEGEPKFKAADDTPSVNGLSGGLLTSNPNLRAPFRLDRTEAFTCDMDHGYTDEQKAFDGGLMDLFVQATGQLGLGCRPDGSSVMGYYDGNTVTAMWHYAQRFAMDDNSFGTEFGPSTPGALELISGQTVFGEFLTFSGGALTGTTATTVIGDTDPAYDDCGKDKGGTANATTLQMNGSNIGNLLNDKKITWGWFEGGFAPTTPAVLNADGTTKSPAVCGSAHTFPATTPNPPAEDSNPTGEDIHTTPVTDYVPHHEPFQFYPSTRNPHHLRPNPDTPTEIGKSDQANHQYDISDFFNALAAGNLPAVSYLKAAAYQDAHPGNSDPLDEQAFVVKVLNALQQSQFWSSTVVVINYDDSDGWYDHLPGPIVNPSVSSSDSFVPLNPSSGTLPKSAFPNANGSGGPQISTSGVCATPGVTAASIAVNSRCGYGPRLPFMVLSPWAKQNFVDHTLTDQTSSLRFIEVNWSLDFIDGPDALPPGQALGQGSWDHFSGSIMNMLDFKDPPNLTTLILDPTTGEPGR